MIQLAAPEQAVQPLGKIHPQPWMVAPQTQAVLDALREGGAEIRFIGGCVRDSILKRPVRDIDIALGLQPDRVMSLLRRAGLRVIPTGIDHGTVTAVVGGMYFEITTLRVDVETDGRRARVAFTDDWIADAARRDFTFNALSCTPDGDVYDYFGGIEDLNQGRVRFVGNANERIGEDILRLLRFFRFYAWYGRSPPDAEALAACRAWTGRIATLSGERVRVEVFRTLMATDPADVFDLMREVEVLPHVLPEASQIGRLRLMTWLDSRALRVDSIEADPVRRLAAVVETGPPGMERLAQRLKLSNEQRDRLIVLATRPWPVVAAHGETELRHALYRHGSAATRDLALLAWADELAATPRLPTDRTAAWVTLMHQIDAWQRPVFPLRGRDAVSLGVAHGRRIGVLLREVEAWWEEGSFRADRDACLAELGRRIHGSTS